MAQSITQEYNRILGDASDAIRDNNKAQCLLHHFDNQRLPLADLRKAVRDCWGRRAIKTTNVRKELENLAVFGAVNIYLDNTFELTSLGKELRKIYHTDPLAEKN